MKRWGLVWVAFVGLFLSAGAVRAKTSISVQTSTSTQTTYRHYSVNTSGYEIKDFASRIEVLANTHLKVAETIRVNFLVPKHGIYRFIPVDYRVGGRTWRTSLEIASVTDETGRAYTYTTSRDSGDIRIKIGDADQTLTGSKTYVITYDVGNVVQRYDGYDEVYWNVTGAQWDTNIERAQVEVVSPLAGIIKYDCFDNCDLKMSGKNELVYDTTDVGKLRDMTVVVGLDPNGGLAWPSVTQIWLKTIAVYFVAVLPLLVMLVYWYMRGRDMAYTSGSINPNGGGQTGLVGVFSREHLPLVYAPIKGLTPSEVGTIYDQNIDIDDVVAEILELARLKYIEIIKHKNDYWFKKLEKPQEGLKSHQVKLLAAITNSKYQPDGAEDGITAVSQMKRRFIKPLSEFKDELYTYLENKLLIENKPEEAKSRGLGVAIVAIAISGVLGWNFWQMFWIHALWVEVFGVAAIAAAAISGFMPRRLPVGHAYYRQIVGLRYYLEKGKWRYENFEKNLFIEEILPLAVGLGVVETLAQEIKALGLHMPQYASILEGDDGYAGLRSGIYHSFTTPAATSSGSSGSGGWSGGSGFSGGFSGGGFGGGGGGSW